MIFQDSHKKIDLWRYSGKCLLDNNKVQYFMTNSKKQAKEILNNNNRWGVRVTFFKENKNAKIVERLEE